MSKKIKISVFVVAYNEEKNIANLLNSLKDFQEVILVDSNSTDKTVEIAKSFKNVQIYNKKWQGFSKQKDYALSKCTLDWVLNLDADEAASQGLKDFCYQLAADKQDSNKEISAYRLALHDVIDGKKLHPWTKFNDKLRLFKRLKGNYNLKKLVHEEVIIDGKIAKAPIKAEIFHNVKFDLKLAVEKLNNYSSLRAEEKSLNTNLSGFRRLSLIITIVLVMPLAFIKSYFIRRNFLNGIYGFIISINNAYYAFLKYAKEYQLISR